MRIGLHTGEADLRADGTYRGAVLNRCARLRSIGHGGQTLVSQATYEVLVEAVANNLPVPLTSFVGRNVEIDAVRALVGESRLLTLTGAGGCGKTRLALAVAAGIADEHPDGVCWVDLAPLSDASLVPAALAGVLGVPESPMEPITDTVVGYLSGGRALVGLDNCEHLIEACAALAATLIEGCAGVTVLATSRELLGVAGEAAWAVPPLSLPHDDAPATSESVQGSPGHDPEDGDLIYFAPWGNLGFYYNTEGIGHDDRVIQLGTYSATSEELGGLETGDVTITVVT